MTVIWTITPCHGRADLIQQLLETTGAARAEVADVATIGVCLVDSTKEGSAEALRIEAMCHTYGATYLRGPESVRGKRNAGAGHAISHGADLLFFTDSDCQLTRDVFRQHLTAYGLAASPSTGRPIGGAIGVTRFVGEQSRCYRAAARTPLLDAFRFAEMMPETPFATCTNFSVRASVFEQVGGFTEGWQYRLGGDDTELGRRINNAGYAIVSRPDAVVSHSTSTWADWGAVVERAWRWGRMDIHVRLAEPPEHLQWIGPMPLQTAVVALPLALLAGWISAALLLFTAVVAGPAVSAALRRPRWSEYLDYLRAEQLVLLFQMGSLLEAARTFHPSLCAKEIVTHPMHIGTSWDARRRSAWVSVAMLLVWIGLRVGLAHSLMRVPTP